VLCLCAVACAALRSAELASGPASAGEVLRRIYPDMRSALQAARETGYDVLVNLPVLRALGAEIDLPPERPEFLGEAYFDLLRRGLAATGRRGLRPAPPGKGEILVEPWPGAPEVSEAVWESEELLRPAARLERLGASEYNAVFGVGLVAIVAEVDGEERGALAPVEIAFRFESGAERSSLEEEFARACEGGIDGARQFCASRSRDGPSAMSFALAGCVACGILLAAYMTRRARGG